MKRWLPLLLCVACAPTLGPAATPDAGTPDAGTPHRIGVRGRELYDRVTSLSFVARGASYVRIGTDCGGGGSPYHSTFNPGAYDAARAEAALTAMIALGNNVARVFLSFKCLGRPLDGAYLDNFADFARRARAHGIYIVPTLDFLPAAYLMNVNDVDFTGDNVNFLTLPGVRAWGAFWSDFAAAMLARGVGDAILEYSIRNEQTFDATEAPLSRSSGIVVAANGSSYDLATDKQRLMDEGLVFAARAIRTAVRAADAEALIGMGFPEVVGSNPWTVGDNRRIRTGPLFSASQPPLDVVGLHPYPGARTLEQYAANFELPAKPPMPVLLEEYGADKATFYSEASTAGVLQDWRARSCALGFSGSLLWTWDTAEQPGFWNARSGNGLIATALAAPDPCVHADFAGENRALFRAATASSSGQSATSLAVDGRSDTSWGSGSSPPQWIEIDLGSDLPLSRVRLLVSQSPSGATVHRVLARATGGSDQLIATLSGNTQDGQLLEVTLSGSYRFIRIATDSGPSWVSWREIEIY